MKEITRGEETDKSVDTETELIWTRRSGQRETQVGIAWMTKMLLEIHRDVDGCCGESNIEGGVALNCIDTCDSRAVVWMETTTTRKDAESEDDEQDELVDVVIVVQPSERDSPLVQVVWSQTAPVSAPAACQILLVLFVSSGRREERRGKRDERQWDGRQPQRTRNHNILFLVTTFVLLSGGAPHYRAKLER